MKRFYNQVDTAPAAGGYAIRLDGRAMRTQGGNPQIVPTQKLAERLAREWADQGETIDPARFVGRDLADYAIDTIAPDRAPTVEKLLAYAETDTLCYRADPDEAFWHRQQAEWEPLVADMEKREGVRLERVSGIMHRPLKPATLERLRERLSALDPFTLAALETLTGLAASLCIGLAALEPGADGDALWNAANLEEDWQAERWGEDAEAAENRARRREAFLAAMAFAASLRPA
ncbi:MAG: molecular chaperone [Erythrobacter sp.]|nr:molecular chaperone [Erythrobacter sp.]